MFLWEWLQVAVSWILVLWHQVFSLLWGEDSGWSWTFAIVGLVVVIRILLIPLFVKQIRAQRNMQAIQPQLKEIQRKHAGDRDAQSQAMMVLYKETGTNPFASCLPLLIQLPIFLALFRLLDQAANDGTGHGALTDTLASRLADARLFGELPIAATFLSPAGHLGVQLLAAVLVVAMTATTYLTQRQLMSKNMPAVIKQRGRSRRTHPKTESPSACRNSLMPIISTKMPAR